MSPAESAGAVVVAWFDGRDNHRLVLRHATPREVVIETLTDGAWVLSASHTPTQVASITALGLLGLVEGGVAIDVGTVAL